ncbi:MAG: hypothetical protein HZC40_13210 [Chloroflexi bacterium]|nr:hypothetical protein [Chloroflexota bacterium]
MISQVTTVIEPFVRRGLFSSPEQAVSEMARDYILRQIERHRATIEKLQTRYGMNYAQFNAYLKSRAATLLTMPNPVLGKAVMQEEQDALDWKIATEMLQSWLGLQSEVGK